MFLKVYRITLDSRYVRVLHLLFMNQIISVHHENNKARSDYMSSELCPSSGLKLGLMMTLPPPFFYKCASKMCKWTRFKFQKLEDLTSDAFSWKSLAFNCCGHSWRNAKKCNNFQKLMDALKVRILSRKRMASAEKLPVYEKLQGYKTSSVLPSEEYIHNPAGTYSK